MAPWSSGPDRVWRWNSLALRRAKGAAPGAGVKVRPSPSMDRRGGDGGRFGQARPQGLRLHQERTALGAQDRDAILRDRNPMCRREDEGFGADPRRGNAPSGRLAHPHPLEVHIEAEGKSRDGPAAPGQGRSRSRRARAVVVHAGGEPLHASTPRRRQGRGRPRTPPRTAPTGRCVLVCGAEPSEAETSALDRRGRSQGMEPPASRDRWVFGYGSLMWRPGFDFVERAAAPPPWPQARLLHLFGSPSRDAPTARPRPRPRAGGRSAGGRLSRG